MLRKKDIENAREQVKSFHFIQCQWHLGKVLNFDTDNSKRIMRLGYLDTMKVYEVFDGDYYTFARGTFDKTTLKCADAAAKLFELDPCLIYTKDHFLRSLRNAMETCDEALDKSLDCLMLHRTSY